MTFALYAKWQRFDSYLIDSCFQPFSDWFRDRTGRSSFWIGKWLLRIKFACIVIGLVTVATNAYHQSQSESFELQVFCQTLIVLIAIFAIAVAGIPVIFKATTFIDSCEEEMDEVFESLGAANPLRIQLELRRFEWTMYLILSCVLMTLWYGIELPEKSFIHVVQAMFFCSVLAMYFFACTPRPRTPVYAPNTVRA